MTMTRKEAIEIGDDYISGDQSHEADEFYEAIKLLLSTTKRFDKWAGKLKEEIAWSDKQHTPVGEGLKFAFSLLTEAPSAKATEGQKEAPR